MSEYSWKNPVTIELPADLVTDLTTAYDIYGYALHAVCSAHRGDPAVLADARRELCAAERDLARVLKSASAVLGVISPALIAAAEFAAKQFAQDADATESRVSDDAVGVAA